MMNSIPITLFKTDPAPTDRRRKIHKGEKRDPWSDYCGRCPLDDCIRRDGDYQPITPNFTYPGCPIWEAASRGLTPAEGLERWQEIGLMEE